MVRTEQTHWYDTQVLYDLVAKTVSEDKAGIMSRSTAKFPAGGQLFNRVVTLTLNVPDSQRTQL